MLLLSNVYQVGYPPLALPSPGVQGHRGLSCKECEPKHYQKREGSVRKRKRKKGQAKAKSEVTMSLCLPCMEDSFMVPRRARRS